jgi:NAD(P)-dependent dehydrogenase (short-subunit alcohol dehydrogenase family)
VYKNIAIIGASGTIGSTFISHLSKNYPEAHIHAISRQIIETKKLAITPHKVDYRSEDSIQNTAHEVSRELPLDLVINATGILHDDLVTPEKSLRNLTFQSMQHLYEIDCIIPSMIAKYFVPKLNKDNRSIFAALSARIGSISDNHLGGWYSYRAAKAALNMMIKTISIEIKRSNKNAIIIGLHPGTVDSPLSKPYQKNLPKGQLFTPDFSIASMNKVLNQLASKDTGKLFAFDGEEINP